MAVQLTTLVETSKPFLLAYTLPLLLLSLVIAFAGTFLTLDRTRTFAPRSDASTAVPGAFDEKPNKFSILWKSFRLDGGVGGLAMGYVFGVHASTFLSLLIMNNSSASPLTPTTFLVVWVFSVIPMTVLGGRWKIAALTFTGITGGITMSLALCIITHPSLTSRVALSSVFTPLVTLSVIMPSVLPSPSLSGIAHSTARLATSCTGAFSMVMAIALLTRNETSFSWANAWERLWVSDGAGWGSSREKGFDALFCALWGCGAAADWALRRWIGEDPDEKWDTYLADYVNTLPNANDRTGNFRPLPSWWDRLLRTLHLSSPNPTMPREILFPSDAELALKPQYISVLDSGDDEKPIVLDLQRAVSPVAHSWEPPSAVKGAAILRKSHPSQGFNDVNAGSAEGVFDLGRKPTFLKKAKSVRVEQRRQRITSKAGKRQRLQFRPTDGFSSDSDSDSDAVSSDMDELKTPAGTPSKEREVYVRSDSSPVAGAGRGFLAHSASATSLSGTTVHPSAGATSSSTEGIPTMDALYVAKERARLADIKHSFGGGDRTASPIPDYSDVEEDVTTAFTRAQSPASRDAPGWQPAFLKRAASSSSGSQRSAEAKGMTPPPPPGAVPMTPSLIRAVERINRAQGEAFRRSPSLPNPYQATAETEAHEYPPVKRRDHVALDMDPARTIPGLPVIDEEQKRRESEDWDEFWKDIRAKAVEAEVQQY